MSEARLLTLKERFYDKLFGLLKNDKNFKDNDYSIFKKFLRAKSNSALDYLDNAAILGDEIDPLILKELIENRYIRSGKEFSKYVMTAKGVWEVEILLDKIDLQRLLNEIDDYKYDIKWGEKLSDKEKVVILSLIAIRAFYEKAPLNRKNGDKFLKSIHEVIGKSNTFLAINNENFNLDLSGETRENLVNAIFARLDKLPKKTRGLYKFDKHKSWLDLYSEKENIISEDKLGYLLWMIFGGNLSIEKQNAINNFCNEILLDYKNYIYNSEEIKNFPFSDIIHQNALNDSLFSIIEKRTIWEEMDKEK